MASIFDNVTGYVGKEYDAATGYVKKEYNAGIDYTKKQYTDLKNSVAVWAREVSKLLNLRVPPHMQSEKNALLSRARSIKAIAEKIFGKIDNLNQLGFIPIVAGVTLLALSALAAYITSWIGDSRALSQRVDVYNSALAKGASPKQAAAVADSVVSNHSAVGDTASGFKDITATLKQYAPLIGIAVIAWVFRGQIARMVKGKK